MKKMLLIRIVCLAWMLLLVLPVNAAFHRPAEKEKTNAPVREENTEQKVATAQEEFHSLSRHERRERIRDMRETLKGMRDHPDETATSTVLLVILAVLLPPLAVGLYEKRLSSKFWISLLLTLLFWVPGVVYAILVVLGVA